MALMLNWYEQQLTQRFGPVVLSEAQREIMRRDFNALQQNMRIKEKTNCWKVPLQLDFEPTGTYRVKIVDESGVLYIDE